MFSLNIGIIGKKYNLVYPTDWLDAQALLLMHSALRCFDKSKGARFTTYWRNWCKHKLPHMWDNECNLIYYPSKPKVTRTEMRDEYGNITKCRDVILRMDTFDDYDEDEFNDT